MLTLIYSLQVCTRLCDGLVLTAVGLGFELVRGQQDDGGSDGDRVLFKALVGCGCFLWWEVNGWGARDVWG